MHPLQSDRETTLSLLKDRVRAFREARGWTDTDNAKNLVMALAVEAAELMEIFSWCRSEESLEHGKREEEHLHEEISDVLIYLLSIADLFDIDLSAAVEDKLIKNARKYPARDRRADEQ